ncbi:MAG: hypothetical protein Q9159_006751 [Coniocarpon cinnabarinum]
MSQILESEPNADSCTAILMKQLSHLSAKGGDIDLGAWLQYYAFDVIGEVTFAKKFGFLEEGRDLDGMIAAIAQSTGQVPEWHSRLLGNPILTKLAPAMEHWNQVLIFTLKALNSRTSLKAGEEMVDEEEQGVDQLSKFRTRKSKSQKIGTRELVSNLSSNVFAGSDTTAIALRSTVYYLCRNPDKYQKMMQELDSADKR